MTKLRQTQLQEVPNQHQNLVAGAWGNPFKDLKGPLTVLQQNLAPLEPQNQPNFLPLSRDGLMNGYQEPAVPQPQDEHSHNDGEATNGSDNYVNISVGPFGFDYAHNGMYRGCLWLLMASYGSLGVHKAPLLLSAHPARVLVASPKAKLTLSHNISDIFQSRKTVLSILSSCYCLRCWSDHDSTFNAC